MDLMVASRYHSSLTVMHAAWYWLYPVLHNSGYQDFMQGVPGAESAMQHCLDYVFRAPLHSTYRAGH